MTVAEPFLDANARKLDPECATVFVWRLSEAPQEYLDRSAEGLQQAFWESIRDHPDDWYLVIDITTRRQEVVCRAHYRAFVRDGAECKTLQ